MASPPLRYELQDLGRLGRVQSALGRVQSAKEPYLIARVTIKESQWRDALLRPFGLFIPRKHPFRPNGKLPQRFAQSY
jgi:hypothetical protein